MILRACNPIFQHDICTEESHNPEYLFYFLWHPTPSRTIALDVCRMFPFSAKNAPEILVSNNDLNRTNIENSIIGSRLAGPGMLSSRSDSKHGLRMSSDI